MVKKSKKSPLLFHWVKIKTKKGIFFNERGDYKEKRQGVLKKMIRTDEFTNLLLNEYKDCIYPVVTIKEELNESVIKRKLINNLYIVYFLKNNLIENFITNQILKSKVEEEDLYEIAFKNLELYGWTKEFNIRRGDYGSFLFFSSDDYVYQTQFFVKSMFSFILGKKFYFSVPTKKESIVYIPDDWKDFEKIQKGKLVLRNFVYNYYKDSNLKKSMTIYRFYEGRYEVVM